MTETRIRPWYFPFYCATKHLHTIQRLYDLNVANVRLARVQVYGPRSCLNLPSFIIQRLVHPLREHIRLMHRRPILEHLRYIRANLHEFAVSSSDPNRSRSSRAEPRATKDA